MTLMTLWVFDVLDDPNYSFHSHWETFLKQEGLTPSYRYFNGLELATYAHLAELPAPTGLLISGSVHSVYENSDWMVALARLIRDVHANQVPILGICFGHQILAHALGGQVSRLPLNREFGCQPVYLTPQGLTHPWLRDFPSGSSTLQSHQDHVATLPPGAQGLGSSSTTEHQIFSLGNALGVQFHPEYTPDTLRIIARSRQKQYLEEATFLSQGHLETLLSHLHPTPAARTILRHFLTPSKEFP